MSAQPIAMPAPKTISPLDEARKLQASIARIDKRERDATNNATMRYQAERNALFEAATPAAKRVLAALDSEVAG